MDAAEVASTGISLHEQIFKNRIHTPYMICTLDNNAAHDAEAGAGYAATGCDGECGWYFKQV